MGKRLTEAEKLARQMARKADGMNARALRDVGGPGSLFAAEAPTFTADDAWRLWRRQKAVAAEGHEVWGPAARAMDWVTLSGVEALAAEVLGRDVAAAIAGRIRTTFTHDAPDRLVARWRAVLVEGKREVRYQREEYAGPPTEWNASGVRVRLLELDPLPAAGGPWLTAEEWAARFPTFGRVAGPDLGPDDPTDLFPRVMAALGG